MHARAYGMHVCVRQVPGQHIHNVCYAVGPSLCTGPAGLDLGLTSTTGMIVSYGHMMCPYGKLCMACILNMILHAARIIMTTEAKHHT